MWLERGRIYQPEYVILEGFMMISTVFTKNLQNCYQILDFHEKDE